MITLVTATGSGVQVQVTPAAGNLWCFISALDYSLLLVDCCSTHCLCCCGLGNVNTTVVGAMVLTLDYLGEEGGIVGDMEADNMGGNY